MLNSFDRPTERHILR